MEEAGIRIDTYRMGEITARLAERVEELEASALELAGEEFQLGSTQQLARILFEKLALTSGRKGKTGYSTDARVLRAIRDDHAIVPVVEEWRELTKLLNTYLLPLPELIDDARRAAAHDDQPGHRRDGAPRVERAEPPEHPGADASAGGELRRAFVRGRREWLALGRLQPGRAPDPRAPVRRPGAREGLRGGQGHPHGDGGDGVRHPRRSS